MDESTITKIALNTIANALEWQHRDKNNNFSYYVNGIVDVTEVLLKKQREIEAKKPKPKPKKRFFI